MSNGETPSEPATHPVTWVQVLTYCAVVALFGLIVQKLELIDDLDKRLADWRTSLLSERAAHTRDEIVVLQITGRTLADYEVQSPISGKLLTTLIREIDKAEPKVLGLDFYFIRQTQFTDTLITAIKAAQHDIVIGAVDDRLPGIEPESLTKQAEILKAAGRPKGHIFLERKLGLLDTGNDIIRYIGRPHPGTPSVPSFASVIASTAGYPYEPKSTLIAWQRPPKSGILYKVFDIPRHKPTDLDQNPSVVLPPEIAKALRCKIVLLGANVADRDQHLTPLSASDGATMPGLLIHAQAVAQRIDGYNGHARDIRELPSWATLLTAFGVAVLCFQLARRLGSSGLDLVMSLMQTAFILCLAWFAFWYWRLESPSAALTVAWGGGTFGGRYVEAILPWFERRLTQWRTGAKSEETDP